MLGSENNIMKIMLFYHVRDFGKVFAMSVGIQKVRSKWRGLLKKYQSGGLYMRKMKMSKKCFPVLLCIALVMSMFSVTVSAEEVTVSSKEALTAAIQDGNTIKLGGEITASIEIPSGTSVTLDLNGQTLTGEGKDAIYVENGASLTIIDSKGNGKVQAAASSYAAVFNNGTVVLSGGYYTRSANQWYTICNHGTMTINEGVTVNTTVDKNSSLIENGYSSYSGSNERNNYVAGTNIANPKLTINGGNITSSGLNPVKNDEGGILEIYGGEFTCPTDRGSVIMNWHIAHIYGGTFTATGDVACVISNGTYGENAKGELKIEGGTFVVDENASNAVLFSHGQGSAAGGAVEVKGGDYTGDFNSLVMDSCYTTNISAGTFTSPKAADYAVDNAVAASLNSTGKTYIGTSAQINDTLNQNASSGDEVTVLTGDADLTGLDQVTVTNTGNGNVTINNVPVEDTPVLTHGSVTAVSEKAATCTEAGNIAYWYCADCGKYFSDSALTTEIAKNDTVIAMKGHTLVKTEGKPATCVEAGHENYWTCSVCHKLFADKDGANEIQAPAAIAKTEHTYGDWTVTKKATATETGSRQKTCSVCGNIVIEAIPAIGESTDVPKTGDNALVWLLIPVLLVSGGACGSLIYLRRKKAK